MRTRMGFQKWTQAASVVLLLSISACAARGAETQAPLPKALVELEPMLSKVIQQHQPGGWVATQGETLVGQFQTQKFMVHTIYKTGEISAQPREELGPNFQGFLLKLTVQKEAYRGAAVSPYGVWHRIYWDTYINEYQLPDKNGYVRLELSYGVRTSKELLKNLKQAVAEYATPLLREDIFSEATNPVLTQQLIQAMDKGDYAAVKRLVTQDVDINARAKSGKTPLILAAEQEDNSTLKLLLDKGAEVNVADGMPFGSWTPLINAVRKTNVEAVKLLLAHGANIYMREAHGWTALYLAQSCEQSPCDEASKERQRLILPLLKEAALHQKPPAIVVRQRGYFGAQTKF